MSGKLINTMTIKWSALTLAGIVATGCAGMPENMAQLDDAQSSYSRANADPIVAKNAALELDDAKKSLDIAQQYWKEGEKKRIIEHYAYLTHQQVAIAEFRAKDLDNQKQLENMKLERQKVQLEVRAGEVERLELKTLELHRQMTELQAVETDRGMVLTLGDVLFDLNKASLKVGAERNISKIAAFMRKYPEKSVLIEGHTDSSGDDFYNRSLSAQRAEAVKIALVLNGVGAERVQTSGLGESVPVASNSSYSGRQQNRRVEVVFENDPSIKSSRLSH
jgi:outer membrane protein OmpA-like peptidoglycan-associated protein